jgi:hypothetical protein
LEQAGIIIRNPDAPFRPTNSPNTVYSISDDVLDAIRKFGTSDWEPAVEEFVKNKGKLIEKYEKRKNKYLIPVDLPDGISVKFSPGKHNELQIKIIKEFRARFCPDTKVVYVGDAARKLLYIDEILLNELKIPITEHDKLDVTLKDCTARRIYVSAFPDFREFKRHIDNIAWETEVWIENNPDHMIHFNGLKFVAAYSD